MYCFRVNYDYDIAIITVAENIVFNEYASPVCLPFKYANYNFAGEKLIVIGKSHNIETIFKHNSDVTTTKK